MSKTKGRADPQSETPPKAPRRRSPNYPSVDLKTLADKLPEVFKIIKRHAVGVDLAVKYLGYSYSSSTGKLALAAMRAFGLYENDGTGMVKLTTRGLDIAVDYPRESDQWWRAVKQAALAPNIHARLWKRYGASLPPDDELRRYLVLDVHFNDNAVGGFVREYKGTIGFAKLSADDKIESDDTEERQVKLGDFVQWTSGGVDQFPTPQQVLSTNDDWAFVEGSETGVPMSELTVQAPPAGIAGQAATHPATPPVNPHYKPPMQAGPTITFPLPNDNAIEIRLKKPVSEKDFNRIQQLVELSKDSLVVESE